MIQSQSEMMNLKNKTTSTRIFGLPQFVKNLDMFGAPIPTFNFRGREDVKTSAGASASVII